VRRELSLNSKGFLFTLDDLLHHLKFAHQLRRKAIMHEIKCRKGIAASPFARRFAHCVVRCRCRGQSGATSRAAADGTGFALDAASTWFECW
jgi:hypothetical protein